MIDAEMREKVIRGLEVCTTGFCSEECPYYQCDGLSCHNPLMRDALFLLKEQEPRVLEYSEIEKHSLVWLEDNDKEYIIPALFLQYDGWNAEFSVHAPDKYVDKIFRFATVIEFEINYGITWRCWTSRPTPEQMRDTKWEEDSDAE